MNLVNKQNCMTSMKSLNKYFEVFFESCQKVSSKNLINIQPNYFIYFLAKMRKEKGTLVNKTNINNSENNSFLNPK